MARNNAKDLVLEVDSAEKVRTLLEADHPGLRMPVRAGV